VGPSAVLDTVVRKIPRGAEKLVAFNVNVIKIRVRHIHEIDYAKLVYKTPRTHRLADRDVLLMNCRTYFEAFTVMMFQVEVYWVVTPCSVVVGYQRFRGPCCLDDGGSMDL
jgi:hypothetical protein